MLSRTAVKTTFEPARVLQPIYTGGSVALDETGCILATCLGEEALLTDLRTGTQLARIDGDGEVITSLALTPSASHIILCSRSLSMRIFSLAYDDPTTLTPSLTYTLKPHPSPVITSAIDSTGTLLATGGADGIIKIWDIRGGYVTHTFRGHSGIISALHFFEVSLSTDTPETGISARNRKKPHRGHPSKDPAVPEGDATRGFRLASGAEDGKVLVWDLSKRKCIATLDSHVSVVRSLHYSPDEHALVSASRDKTAIIWDARTWKLRRLLTVLESLESVGFLASGAVIFTGGENGHVRLWETSTGREITQDQTPAEGDGENIVAVLHHPGDPSYLLSVHGNESLVLLSLASLSTFQPTTGTLPPLSVYRRISGTHDEIIDLAYLTPSKSYLALATNSEDIRIISISTHPSSSPLNSSSSFPSAVTQSTPHFGADIATLSSHADIVICLCADWSGHWLATGSKDNTAILWRIDPSTSSYTIHATFTGHAESLGAIALPSAPPPAGTPAHTDPLSHPPPYLLTGSQDRTVKRWEIPRVATKKSPRATYTRKAHDKDINALDISAASSSSSSSSSTALFASASQDRTVKIFSVDEGETLGILRGHRRGVWSVKFAPANTPSSASFSTPSSRGGSGGGGGGGGSTGNKGTILTGSGDKTIKLWSLADYSCLLTLEGHTGSVLKVIWLPSLPSSAAFSSSTSSDPEAAPAERQASTQMKASPQIASAGGDGLVKVWSLSLPSGECDATLDNHEDRVWCLASSIVPAPASHVSPASGVSAASLTSPASHISPDVSMDTSGDGIVGGSTSTSENSGEINAQRTIISGSSDSTLTLWADTTRATLQRARAHVSAQVEAEQRLENLAASGHFREAIGLALGLNHPGRLLGLLSAAAGQAALVMHRQPGQAALAMHGKGQGRAEDDGVQGKEKEKKEEVEKAAKSVAEVEDALGTLGRGQLMVLLRRVRDWNTNARTAMVAQWVLGVVVRRYDAAFLAGLGRRERKAEQQDEDEDGDGGEGDERAEGEGRMKQGEGKRERVGMKELVDGLRTYSERHYKRLEGLEEEGWVVEYTLGQMAETSGLAVDSLGREEEDVMMV